MRDRPDWRDEQGLRYAQDLARLHRLRRTYERLVPRALDPTAPEPSEALVRTASVLFTDLRGFTGLAERFLNEPATLLAVLNAHLTVVVRAITECEGVVEKFLGDGVFATFGAREDVPHHEELAVAPALSVVGANEALNRRYSAAWGFRLDVRVGAAAGKVVVGGIGPPERSEWGVLGDPVNVAARLVEAAKSCEVLLSESLYGGLARTVRADLLGHQAVRGRTQGIDVYRVPTLVRPT